MIKPLKFLSKVYHKVLISTSSKARLKSHLLSKEEKILLSLKEEGFLKDTGWIDSRLENASIDIHKKPVPWMSYSMIMLLKERLNPEMTVFEYGSGHSTQFFAERVNHITSVEHDDDWIQRIAPKLPENADLIKRELVYGGAYAKSIHETGGKFDLVVIDGRDRVNCCKQAVGALHERGVIILDNADRDRYTEGIQFLRSRGFKMLKFWGLAPISPSLTCTAIFYRQDNCFEL